MELTKEKAIEEHRKMWNWIANELLKPETQTHNLSVYDLKTKYCNKHGVNILHNCWCCEYDYQFADDTCMNCPLIWGTESELEDYFCEGDMDKTIEGLWSIADEHSNHGEYEGASKLARQIANLLEKESEE